LGGVHRNEKSAEPPEIDLGEVCVNPAGTSARPCPEIVWNDPTSASMKTPASFPFPTTLRVIVTCCPGEMELGIDIPATSWSPLPWHPVHPPPGAPPEYASTSGDHSHPTPSATMPHDLTHLLSYQTPLAATSRTP
jgi:hypothetical protein